MHMNLWSNLPQIKKIYDELWGKVPYSMTWNDAGA